MGELIDYEAYEEVVEPSKIHPEIREALRISFPGLLAIIEGSNHALLNPHFQQANGVGLTSDFVTDIVNPSSNDPNIRPLAYISPTNSDPTSTSPLIYAEVHNLLLTIQRKRYRAAFTIFPGPNDTINLVLYSPNTDPTDDTIRQEPNDILLQVALHADTDGNKLNEIRNTLNNGSEAGFEHGYYFKPDRHSTINFHSSRSHVGFGMIGPGDQRGLRPQLAIQTGFKSIHTGDGKSPGHDKISMDDNVGSWRWRSGKRKNRHRRQFMPQRLELGQQTKLVTIESYEPKELSSVPARPYLMETLSEVINLSLLFHDGDPNELLTPTLGDQRWIDNLNEKIRSNTPSRHNRNTNHLTKLNRNLNPEVGSGFPIHDAMLHIDQLFYRYLEKNNRPTDQDIIQKLYWQASVDGLHDITLQLLSHKEMSENPAVMDSYLVSLANRYKPGSRLNMLFSGGREGLFNGLQIQDNWTKLLEAIGVDISQQSSTVDVNNIPNEVFFYISVQLMSINNRDDYDRQVTQTNNSFTNLVNMMDICSTYNQECGGNDIPAPPIQLGIPFFLSLADSTVTRYKTKEKPFPFQPSNSDDKVQFNINDLTNRHPEGTIGLEYTKVQAIQEINVGEPNIIYLFFNQLIPKLPKPILEMMDFSNPEIFNTEFWSGLSDYIKNRQSLQPIHTEMMKKFQHKHPSPDTIRTLTRFGLSYILKLREENKSKAVTMDDIMNSLLMIPSADPIDSILTFRRIIYPDLNLPKDRNEMQATFTIKDLVTNIIGLFVNNENFQKSLTQRIGNSNALYEEIIDLLVGQRQKSKNQSDPPNYPKGYQALLKSIGKSANTGLVIANGESLDRFSKPESSVPFHFREIIKLLNTFIARIIVSAKPDRQKVIDELTELVQKLSTDNQSGIAQLNYFLNNSNVQEYLDLTNETGEP